MAKQRKYTKEFKLEALRLYETSDKSITEIEQDLGITPGMMNKWRRRYQTEGEQAFRGKGRQDDNAAELRRLQREVEVLRQERDILKTYTEVVSKQQASTAGDAGDLRF